MDGVIEPGEPEMRRPKFAVPSARSAANVCPCDSTDPALHPRREDQLLALGLSYGYLWRHGRASRRGNDHMKRTVAEAHLSEYPNPIGFAAGETVTLGREDTDYPGWGWVTTGDGNAGWAPLVYLEIAADGLTAVTTTAYSARELNTAVGEELEILGELNDWTRVRNAAGDEGWVPSSTLRQPTAFD